ncbi:c-type cytochrome biogenesis protein CcmI [Litoreibacter roseus]|uniref:Cytochrome c-type biogenesis protein CycH n=1 Tax=Litoreibacter roseus TaxID=2601869 RepID=A0A6N6JDS5_9RHOB|nr:c-type cytochrome biogenesis protein CcmI [Litoreibacter roseus]GFE63980.1 cytochrome c-type biogenesis protein CycH [Litoreibacter roseus]
MFWTLALLMAAVSAAFVLWPMRRADQVAVTRSESAMAIFKDQLAEVDRDAARGLISDIEAKAARTEIKRRMLATDEDSAKAQRTGGLWVIIATAALVPLGGAALYSVTGAPGTPSLAFADRGNEQQNRQELVELTARLSNRLSEDPEGGETRGWTLLASTYTNMGRYAEAAEAWSRIVERDDATSGTWSQYAEALIASEGGVVTQAAERAIEQAIALDPSNPAGTYYRAVALDQAGQTVDARQLLLDRVNSETQPQPWMEVFLREANRMGEMFGLEPVGLPDFPDAPRGPSQADIAAAQDMTSEEQRAFIRSMVDGLAARLEDEPNDLQGWLQLARAYMVLGERDNAREALQSASLLTTNLPEDDPRRQTVEQGLSELSP